MTLILGKSKALKPKPGKEIRHVGELEQKAIAMTKEIAKQFGVQSKQMKPKKMIFR
jgi:hypothetical protein